MALPITAFYAGLGALWLIFLTATVIRLRRRRRVSLGDGCHDNLARAAQRNAAETLPLALLLLGLAGRDRGHPPWSCTWRPWSCWRAVVHAAFFLRRARVMRYRVAGMAMTLGAIGFLAVGPVAHGLRDMAS